MPSPIAINDNEIKLVIFDCDGVLVDSEYLSQRVIIEMLGRLDIHIDIPYFDAHFLGKSYASVCARIALDFGITLPESFQADYHNELMAVFAKELQSTPDLVPFLQSISVPFCVATSSSPQRTEFALGTTGLLHWFQGYISTALEVENGKPAPDLFLLAAEKVGIAPENCLVIEDSGAGVQAGVAAGMQTLRYIGAGHFANKSADTLEQELVDSEFSCVVPQVAHWREMVNFVPNILQNRSYHE